MRWEPERLVAEVASSRADAAILWGAEAARYVKTSSVPLAMHFIPERQGLRCAIALGVRREDRALLAALERA